MAEGLERRLALRIRHLVERSLEAEAGRVEDLELAGAMAAARSALPEGSDRCHDQPRQPAAELFAADAAGGELTRRERLDDRVRRLAGTQQLAAIGVAIE